MTDYLLRSYVADVNNRIDVLNRCAETGFYDLSKNVGQCIDKAAINVVSSTNIINKNLNNALFMGIWYHFSGDMAMPFYLMSKMTKQTNSGISSFSYLMYWGIVAKHFTLMTTSFFCPIVIRKITELVENNWQPSNSLPPTEREIEEANKACIQQSVKSFGKLCMIGLATWYLRG